MANEVQIHKPLNQLTAFSDLSSFELAQRQAKALADSDLVPTTYRGKVANCLVALEVAQRCHASPLMVMQNLHLIQGRPSWSSSYIIAAVNSSNRFAPLRFKVTGEGDQKTCIAWTSDRSGEILEGPPVSIAMAKAEGWYQKTGSKWQTMPDLMLRYRAAAFFGRLYAPEILLGMRTDDEEREIIDITPDTTPAPSVSAASVNEKIKRAKAEKKPPAPQIDTTPSDTHPVANGPDPGDAATGAVEGHF